MSEKETVEIVQRNGTLHTLKDEHETDCGIEYLPDEVEEHPINWAGIWCGKCLDERFHL